jgi:hypothetical protein
MTDPDIQQRINELPRQYREFIYSGFATEAAAVLGTAEDLTPQQVKIFESLILLYLLFFVDKNNIIEILIKEGIAEKAATGLVWGLEKSLPDFAKQTEQSFENEDEEALSNLETEIAEAELDLVTLQTVRTMSQDMSAIKPGSDVVYQSNQADILARYNIPQPEVVSPPTEPPRWGTDSAK